jgi:LacI family transcriptional regulator, repressor for deo operon, udp, cdd, tsx, nupC, and nupG
MSKHSTNQRAIAEALNVSQTTVTKVLNHDPFYRVSPQTRGLILKTASEFGYQPRRRRPGNIALVFCEGMYAAEHELSIAMHAEASRMGYRLFTANLRQSPTYRELSYVVNPLSADAAIINGNIDPDVAAKLSDIMPVLVIGESDVSGRVDRMSDHHARLGEKLTNHVLSRGHRRIAVIVHSLDTPSWKAALTGYEKALGEAGIETDMSIIGEKANRYYHELLSELLGCSPKPTALLAWTTADHLAILSTLAAMGYRVPRDLSYVGWAASSLTNLNPYPALTCLDDIFTSMSRAAVVRLLDRIEDRTLPARELFVESTIRVGETCAQCPAESP